MKLLSICIPAYNRYNKLLPTIKEILTSESNDFELLVVDNASPSIPDEIYEIKDSRFRFVERKVAVNGVESVSTCMLDAEGLFYMILLDKDRINGKYLCEFIENLNIYKNEINGGYCAQNANVSLNNIQIYNTNLLEKFGYLSRHPSGEFYRTDIVKEIIKNGDKQIVNDPFAYDIYLTQCASETGSMMIYGKPLIYLETIEDSKNTGSLTFSSKNNNLYFMPDNRVDEFKNYFSHLKTLNIDKKTYENILTRLYKMTLINVTYIYKDVMCDDMASKHYRFEKKDVTNKEIEENKNKFNKEFIKVVNDDKLAYKIINENRLYYHLKGVKQFLKGIINGK